MIALRGSKNAELLWTACALVPIDWLPIVYLIAAASIRERRLFRSARPEVRRQFGIGD